MILKKTWAIINDLIGCKKSRLIEKIFHNNQFCEDDSMKAEIFNDYFSSIAASLLRSARNSGEDPLRFMGNPVEPSMEFIISTPS